jgi:hypothetical protein
MSKINVTVSKVSTEPTKNNNYIHTLKTEGKEVEVLGQKKMSGQLTYFIALPGVTPVGTASEIDMGVFTVTERPFDVTDEQTGETQTLLLKWLHIK